METKCNFRGGSVKLLVLHSLNRKDYYGCELTQILKHRQMKVIDIPVNSLYPVLYKLIDNDYISNL